MGGVYLKDPITYGELVSFHACVLGYPCTNAIKGFMIWKVFAMNFIAIDLSTDFF